MTVSPKDKPFLNTFCNNGHHFPALWEYMFPEEFSYLHIPGEKILDCSNCNKVHTDAYNPKTKCCTYFPQIPNFMLGLALKDPSCRELAIAVIEQGHAVPEGTLQTPAAVKVFADEYAKDQFGKSKLLRCPFLDEKAEGCGIYAYRSAVCASFFCQNEHGDAGDKYWERFQDLLRQAEVALYQRAMTEVGIDSTDYNRRLDSLADRIGEVADPQTGGWTSWARETLFGDFFGNEISFFEKCADFVVENKDKLYEIATTQKTTMAFRYEKALEHGLTEAQRREIQYLPDTMGEPVPVEDLWYKLQLATRRLWELPFNEGTVKLNPNASIETNKKQDVLSKLHGDRPMVVVVPVDGKSSESVCVYLIQEQADLLQLFTEPRVLGEAVFELPEIANFSGARDFLAECLRRSVLVHQP